MSAADRIVAFDYYGTGKMDHLLLYRRGTGLVVVVEHGAGNTFYLMGVWGNGLGGWDMSSPADRVVAFDYYGTGKMDHLVLYRPGTGLIAVLEHGSSNTFYLMGVWSNGLAGYDLASPADSDYSIRLLRHRKDGSFGPLQARRRYLMDCRAWQQQRVLPNG